MPTHYGGTKLDITIDGTELGDPQEAAKYEYDVVDQLRRVLDVYGEWGIQDRPLAHGGADEEAYHPAVAGA